MKETLFFNFCFSGWTLWGYDLMKINLYLSWLFDLPLPEGFFADFIISHVRACKETASW